MRRVYKSELDLQWSQHKQAVYAAKMLNKYLDKGERRFIVLFPTQGGKTSIVQAVAELLGVRGPHRVVYLCSYDRKAYRYQIESDLAVFEAEECVSLIGNEIKKYVPKPNDIVIVDEAGYGVSEDQRLDKALKNVNAIVIAVSATPYEAMKSSWSGRIIAPTPEQLKGYVGVWTMLEHGQIKRAEECVRTAKGKRRKELTPWLCEILEGMPDRAYGIVRVRDRQEANTLQKVLAREGVAGRVWAQNSALPRPIKDVLSTMPRRKTIIIVVNHLRMGERIVDTYLDFVIDRIAKTRSLNNTVVQSLLGRCCGWDKTLGKVTVYTDIEEAKAYTRMWAELWENKDVTMMSRNNATKNFKGSNVIVESADARIEIITEYSQLPEVVKAHIKRGLIMSRTKKHKSQLSYVAANKGRKIVETKSYFGKGMVSDNNLRKVLDVLKAIRAGKNITSDYLQFAKRHKNKEDLSPYALFCIQTDELYEEYGVKSDSFILLTRLSDRYMRQSSVVELKRCLFTTLSGDAKNEVNGKR